MVTPQSLRHRESFFDGNFAIDEGSVQPGTKLLRVIIGCMVGDDRRIKHCNISLAAHFNHAAVVKTPSRAAGIAVILWMACGSVSTLRSRTKSLSTLGKLPYKRG